jgi:CO/xanthine dehydrogenase Mo-binding subunit
MAQTAAIADVEVNKKTGTVTVTRVYDAMSQGLAVYPGGIENQIVGGTIVGVSWVLREQLQYRTSRAETSSPRRFSASSTRPRLRRLSSSGTHTRNSYAAGVGELPVIAVPAAVAKRFLRRDGRPDADSATDPGPRPHGTESAAVA